MSEQNFQNIFQLLKLILKKFEKHLILKTDSSNKYFLYTPIFPDGKTVYKNNSLYFGGVEIKKNYVSFHLFAIYMYPELIEKISPELKKRMQGKSCFNFKKADEMLFNEIKKLTESCFEKYKIEKYL